MRRIKLMVLPIALLPLSSCSTEGTIFSGAKIYCPTGRVVSDAAQLSRFRQGGQPVAADIALTVELSPPRVECDYDSDERLGDVEVTVPITLRQGPAKTLTQDEFTYFVAVVDFNNVVQSRKDYRVNLALDGQQAAVFNEQVDDISVSVAEGRMLADYRVVVGLQLSPAEMSYNQATRSRIP